MRRIKDAVSADRPVYGDGKIKLTRNRKPRFDQHGARCIPVEVNAHDRRKSGSGFPSVHAAPDATRLASSTAGDLGLESERVGDIQRRERFRA